MLIVWPHRYPTSTCEASYEFAFCVHFLDARHSLAELRLSATSLCSTSRFLLMEGPITWAVMNDSHKFRNTTTHLFVPFECSTMLTQPDAFDSCLQLRYILVGDSVTAKQNTSGRNTASTQRLHYP